MLCVCSHSLLPHWLGWILQAGQKINIRPSSHVWFKTLINEVNNFHQFRKKNLWPVVSFFIWMWITSEKCSLLLSKSSWALKTIRTETTKSQKYWSFVSTKPKPPTAAHLQRVHPNPQSCLHKSTKAKSPTYIIAKPKMKAENLRTDHVTVYQAWKLVPDDAECVLQLTFKNTCRAPSQSATLKFTFPQCHSDTLSMLHTGWKTQCLTRSSVLNTLFHDCTTWFIGSKLWVTKNVYSLTCKKCKCLFFW